MKRLLLLLLLTAFSIHTAWALTGREIIEKSDNLPEPDTAYSSVIMTIHKGSRVIEKEFTLEALKLEKNETQALISFIRPTKIKLLTHTHKAREDDQWLRLSSGRIKRITASSKDKSFVNSHFYYEDLTSRNIDDYSYTLIGEEKALGFDCYTVESKRKQGRKVYDKTLLYVRKSDFFVVKIDFYRKGKFDKTLENFDIRKVDTILTPFKSIMSDGQNNGKTELSVSTVKYNINIPATKFRKEALR